MIQERGCMMDKNKHVCDKVPHSYKYEKVEIELLGNEWWLFVIGQYEDIKDADYVDTEIIYCPFCGEKLPLPGEGDRD